MSVAIGSFLVFAASQVGTPGPANMALMATGARFGLRRAVPFLAGVIAGKQFIIWPMGFGLLALGTRQPWIFETLKWVSAAYICYLAWRVTRLRLGTPEAEGAPAPGFAAGLIVHPLNPKAWAMITAGFTSFTAPGTPALQATLTIALCLLACQIVLQPIWAWGGSAMAARVAGTAVEPILMYVLAGLTLASVLYVLFGGGPA
ncbi:MULTISPECIES: LysE family translocator [Dinoroseobacter]|jgi:threonine/homoserine/homoserine lactone efflux protein|nr:MULTISPECIES: LysE family translocator [Dinoroseobacter]MDD9715707.1 LysE family translocator [Dinoroseobacter sp. PD6]URF48124.1 LysE family translocator [Dinoroseobacter shibae]URF52434.1 LysE family translocator [Dinoroseobacter shibae]